MNRSSNFSFKTLAIVGTLAAAMTTNVTAGGTMKIAGRLNCKNVKQEVLPYKPDQGSLLLLERFECTNKSTGPSQYMDGAAVVNEDVAALLQGSGPNNGYITFSKGEDRSVTKWSGQVRTAMEDGQPHITLFGTWEKLEGAGKYQGLQGRGSYHGYFVSKTEYVLEFVGEISTPVASN